MWTWHFNLMFLDQTHILIMEANIHKLKNQLSNFKRSPNLAERYNFTPSFSQTFRQGMKWYVSSLFKKNQRTNSKLIYNNSAKEYNNKLRNNNLSNTSNFLSSNTHELFFKQQKYLIGSIPYKWTTNIIWRRHEPENYVYTFLTHEHDNIDNSVPLEF